jgi:biopolymer transport protein ExbD
MKTRVRRNRVVSEINITPFTDVVLVLLVIFMITTPILMQSKPASGSGNDNSGGFNVQLPQAKSTNQLPSQVSHLVVVILQDGRVVVSGEAISEDALIQKLQEVKQQNPDTLVIIQADKMVNTWRLVRVMDLASAAGLKQMAIATVEE